MRLLRVVLLLALMAGCTGNPSTVATAISCQPFGYSPAPVAFSFAPGPVTASSAEQTALALFRACSTDANVTITITDLSSSVAGATGSPAGPNSGQDVWLVQIDATQAVNGGSSQSHYLVEVNKATGVPTVIAYG